MRGRVRAHDPFELIRWLALSQPDPRKALAELVQNSLDAGARRIFVSRVRERGRPCLKILDDGDGVIPEMERAEALRYIATHIGHSRKRSLSPQERLTLMTQGQYGIGLLGFWSLGETLEMRTLVPGRTPHRLVLHRERPDFLIEPYRARLDLDERWTEVVVSGLHREAMPVLGARRAADYLAAELRGQLLARDVAISLEDRMARGRAPKRVRVRPPRFLGERVEGIGQVEVPGHPPLRLEVYLAGEERPEEEPRGLAVYASGTLVAQGFHELASVGLDRPPWTDPRLIGMVDFPGLHVAPGSRRGVVPDDAAGAFAEALRGVEPVLAGVLEAFERRRAEELDRSLVRDLQRAFRDFYRQRPRYAMLPVQGREEGADAGAGRPPGAAAAGDAETPAAGPAEGTEAPGLPEPPAPQLLPAGPLVAVQVTPAEVRIECGGRKRVRAAGLDASGRAVGGEVSYAWRLNGPVGLLEEAPDGPDQVIIAAAHEPASGSVEVFARSGANEARAEASVEVVEEIGGHRAGEGIPEPEILHEPAAGWRSRMQAGRWQVNGAHRDFRAVAERPALKLRYMAMLFAKEIVLRSSQDPRLEAPLEQVVEVAAFADRNLGRRRGKGRGEEDEP